jgi:hypothetical protein
VYNFHGEPGARLNVDQSVYATVPKKTLLIKLLSPLLFYAPDFHFVGLQTIYTDGLIRHRGWAEFITRLNGEWQEFTLYVRCDDAFFWCSVLQCFPQATVVLNANVAFLAIQSVDNNGYQNASRSPTQISSYLSVLTSIGSIIIGLLLVKQNRNRDRVTAPDAVGPHLFHLTKLTLCAGEVHLRSDASNAGPRDARHLVFLALCDAYLVVSLLPAIFRPRVLTLSARMVSFLAAFSFMCFEHSSLVTRTLVAILWAAVAALILWCVFTAWESGDWDWLPSLSSCWRPACIANVAEDDQDATQDETKSVVASESKKPWKSLWTWPVITLRKASYDSERTVTNV